MRYVEWKFYLPDRHMSPDNVIREQLSEVVKNGRIEGNEFVLLHASVAARDWIVVTRAIEDIVDSGLITTSPIGYMDLYELVAYVQLQKVHEVVRLLIEAGVKEICTNGYIAL
ncbi:MAG: hypothetical protein Q7S80_02765 [bacterium]|nr:hypothetical protein [bacterium]